MKSYTIKLKLSQKDIQELHSKSSYADVFGSVFSKLMKATKKQVQDYDNILSEQQKCHLLTSAFYKDFRSEINPDWTHLSDEMDILNNYVEIRKASIWDPFLEKENRELKALLTENKIPEGYWPSQIRPISPEYAKAEENDGE